jgi:hypothetical protein
MAKPGNAIHIPLPFEETISAVLKVKPPPRTPRNPKAKATTKGAGGKQTGKEDTTGR